ncbi:MAG TPA: hypothetical protein VGC54_12915 [Planctomycetota bacterium]
MQRLRLLLPIPILIGAALVPAAQDPVVQDPVIHDGIEAAPVLEDHMEAIELSVKRLRRSLRDATKAEESLDWVVKAEHAALAAKAMVPKMSEHVPEAKRAEFQLAYRREIAVLIEHMLTLEIALLDGDADAANEAFTALRELEEPAHARFTEDE